MLKSWQEIHEAYGDLAKTGARKIRIGCLFSGTPGRASYLDDYSVAVERLARPYSAVDFHLLSFASLSWRTPLVGHGISRARSGRPRLGPWRAGESVVSHNRRAPG